MKGLKKTNRRWFILYIVISFLYFNWRLWFTIPMQDGVVSFVFGILLLIAEGMGMFEFMIHFMNMSSVITPRTPTVDKDVDYPEVDVFIASYNEPMSLLYKTIVGAKNMSYPDKSKVHIYLLDDGNREEAGLLCKRLGITHLTRETNEHAKAGNINAALKRTSSPYIVTLDADMIPLRSFLMETIPFFIENEQTRLKEEKEGCVKTAPLGFLQTPQAFYNPDVFQHYLFLEHEIPNEQDYFYRSVQLGKNKSNSVIYAGSNTVISRQALDEIGGFVTGIITEDIATGLNMQKSGYQSLALSTVQATGLSPDDLRTIVKQRKRWGRGCIQTFRRFNPFTVKGLSIKQRLNYFDSLCYWYGSVKRFIFIMAPILFTVFGVKVLHADLLRVLMFWIPMNWLIKKMFQLYTKNIRTSVWSDIYETIMMPNLMTAILLETFGIKQKRFEVTDKEGLDVVTKKEKIRFAFPHLLLLGLSFYGILVCLSNLFTEHWASYVMALFWLAINLYNLTMAIFFALGRPLYQNKYLSLINEKIEVKMGEELITYPILKISETELVVQINDCELFNSQETFNFSIKTDNYQALLSGRVVEIVTEKSGKVARLKFEPISEHDYHQLILILFDREPVLPKTIQKKSRVYYLKQNVIRRLGDEAKMKRGAEAKGKFVFGFALRG